MVKARFLRQGFDQAAESEAVMTKKIREWLDAFERLGGGAAFTFTVLGIGLGTGALAVWNQFASPNNDIKELRRELTELRAGLNKSADNMPSPPTVSDSAGRTQYAQAETAAQLNPMSRFATDDFEVADLPRRSAAPNLKQGSYYSDARDLRKR